MPRRTTILLSLASAVTALAFAATSAADPFRTSALPPDLAPWVPWVMDDEPDYACPAVDGAAVCVWPGALELDLSAEGGDFVARIHSDREILYPLPGDALHWPQEVLLNGRTIPVLDRDGLPHAVLPAGDSRIEGTVYWREMPEGIRIPRETAMVAVRVDGVDVPFPRRDEDGLLWLQSAEGAGKEGDALALEVFRKLTDGIPILVETRIVLRASGKSREIDLGKVLLEGTEIMSVDADVPARVDKDSRLRVQVRAGTHNVTLVARVAGARDVLGAEERPEPWPSDEIWVWQADEVMRQVSLTGPSGIDPSRTSMPKEWTSLPAYLMAPGAQLKLATTRRGEPDPPPDQLSLSREFWMDLDGGGYTVRDGLTGDLNRTWRLDLVAAGSKLGHAAVDGEDQLITENPKTKKPGVELRKGALALTAEWRLESGTRKLPAVGWTEDVQRLSATLNLPPGWTLLTASGVDELPGTWWDEWDLFGFFFVLLVSLAFGKLTRWFYGVGALVVLVLLHMEAELAVVVFISLSLLVTLGLLKVLKRGVLHVILHVSWWVSVVILALALVPFSVDQFRTGLYPQIDDEGMFTDFDQAMTLAAMGNAKEAMEPPMAPAPMQMQQAMDEEQLKNEIAAIGMKGGQGTGEGTVSAGEKDIRQRADGADVGVLDALSSLSRASGGESEYGNLAGKKKAASKAAWRSALQQDPKAVVQTGPGVPTWRWRSWSMSWSGPVNKDHGIKLYLLGPGMNLFLSVLRVLLLVGLAFVLVREALATIRGTKPGARAAKPSGAVKAAAAATALGLGLLVCGTARGQEIPSQEMLDALRGKITRAPDCSPTCTASSRLDIEIANNKLVITADASMGAAGGFRIPGPAGNWVPATVSVDGRPTSAVALLEDGFLHVRLDKGQHTVVAEGPLPKNDAVTLELGEQPHLVEASAPGWDVAGIRDDGRADSSIQLSRVVQAAPGAAPTAAVDENAYPPWLEVARTFDFGIPWLVHTTVRRVSPSGSPIVARIPLLPGESVTESELRVEGGAVVVSLGRDDTESTWSSTLGEQPGIDLTAAVDAPWSEVWIVRCSPIWQCGHDGIAPIHHEVEGRLEPTFRPWPGEKLALTLGRPAGVEGQSITVDSAALTVSPGIRLLSATLDLVVRSSRGGVQGITLPEKASIQVLSVDGQARPYRMNGRKLEVTLMPGGQRIHLEWQQPGGISAKQIVPEVVLSGSAANTTVTIELPGDRWLLWAGGPNWGPAVLFWGYIAVILIAAFVLSRLAFSPLKGWQWALLGLGLTQVPAAVSLVIVGWFLVLAWRRRKPPEHFFWHNSLQIVLGLWTLGALICLFGAVYQGLAVQPDMQVAGASSTNTHLVWYADRTEGALPRPWVVSLPLLVWKITMLAWSLWLAYSLVRWGQWAWKAYSAECLWRSLPRPPRQSVATAQPPTPERPPAAPEAPPEGDR